MTGHSFAAAKSEALDAALRELFRTLRARPVPDVFRLIVEQLEESPPERAAAAA